MLFQKNWGFYWYGFWDNFWHVLKGISLKTLLVRNFISNLKKKHYIFSNSLGSLILDYFCSKLGRFWSTLKYLAFPNLWVVFFSKNAFILLKFCSQQVACILIVFWFLFFVLFRKKEILCDSNWASTLFPYIKTRSCFLLLVKHFFLSIMTGRTKVRSTRWKIHLYVNKFSYKKISGLYLRRFKIF